MNVWHANATGFYSGHTDAPDFVRDNLAQLLYPNGSLPLWPRNDRTETWLRGALPTDKNGVSVLTSVFPGYYSYRATHIHVRVHPEWKQLDNSTFTSGRLVHTGQFFIDDKLNQEIDKVSRTYVASRSVFGSLSRFPFHSCHRTTEIHLLLLASHVRATQQTGVPSSTLQVEVAIRRE